MPLRIGETFAEYRVLRLLGSGGMGEVYLVQHPRLPRQEALKVLRPDLSSDSSFRERFIREADLAAGLRHPHIVGIHDRGEYDGQLWIAMDFIDGEDVASLLARKYPAGMPIGLVLTVTSAVASALDYAHKKGLLHRDVKPANVIVAELDTDEPTVFLADFGIARPLDDTSGITTTNMTVGTVAYSAPEQLMGEPMDGRADQYALAATTYNLLTGSQLYPSTNPAVVISRHLNTTPPKVGDHRPDSAGLDDVLQIALAKNPADRFPFCSAFTQALVDESSVQGPASANATTQAAGQRRTSASTIAARPPKPPAARSRLVWVALSGFAATLLVIGAIWMWWRPWQHPQSNTAISSSGNAPTTPTPNATAASPSAAAPPRRPNPVGEAQFVADVHANIPTANIPGGRPTDARLVAYGYQACSMMDRYPNPASAAAPFYEAVARDAGYTRDPATIDKTSANEVWFMTIAAQYLCDAPAPPPVTPTAAPATIPSGPTIGDQCSDSMKFSTDPLSGQEMLCSGYPENLNRGEPMKWYSAEASAVGPSAGWADAPRVGRTGSSCSGEVPFTTGRSSDGFGVWCVGDGALADENPIWAVYQP